MDSYDVLLTTVHKQTHTRTHTHTHTPTAKVVQYFTNGVMPPPMKTKLCQNIRRDQFTGEVFSRILFVAQICYQSALSSPEMGCFSPCASACVVQTEVNSRSSSCRSDRNMA